MRSTVEVHTARPLLACDPLFCAEKLTSAGRWHSYDWACSLCSSSGIGTAMPTRGTAPCRPTQPVEFGSYSGGIPMIGLARSVAAQESAQRCRHAAPRLADLHSPNRLSDADTRRRALQTYTARRVWFLLRRHSHDWACRSSSSGIGQRCRHRRRAFNHTPTTNTHDWACSLCSSSGIGSAMPTRGAAPCRPTQPVEFGSYSGGIPMIGLDRSTAAQESAQRCRHTAPRLADLHSSSSLVPTQEASP
ncbi:hypothetical protein J6590_003134 [Homalodisca vitripennis]|nr:hypothetical protein J6590_003134 [Homalodisca vitripennis]